MGLQTRKHAEASGYRVKDRRKMYVVIGADLVPTKSNIDLFINGDKESLIGKELKDVLDGASYRIFNLEVPLTDKEKPIVKQGPNLIASTAAVAGYRALRVDLLTLANNHILDQDVSGLESTVRTLDKAGISHVGTGENVRAASKPFIFTFAEKKIGVYACAEHEFSIATETIPGANPFDPLWSLDHTAELKKSVDYVIVLYHGGKEHYRYPSPFLQKTCRRLVDKGADLVICQHSHCIGCEEKYSNGTIVYGQGNFIFDDSEDECWQTSLLVKLDDDFTVSYIPLVKENNGVRLAKNQMKEMILYGFMTRSSEIIESGFVQARYRDYAESFHSFYLRAFSGRRSLLFRILNKMSGGYYLRWYLQNTYDGNSQVRIENYIDCEAHRELMSQALANSYMENGK